MKKTIATLIILASASFASAAQQCTATCMVYDKTDREIVAEKSIVSIAKNAVIALDDLNMQCFDIGHYAVAYGHASSRDVQDLNCKTIKAKN